MHYIIGNTQQFESFTAVHGAMFPIQVLDRLRKRIETFDSSYGSDRNLEADLGGYTVLFPSMNHTEQKERENILRKYHVSEEEFECREEILQKDGCLWIEELYILSSDYGILFFYPSYV